MRFSTQALCFILLVTVSAVIGQVSKEEKDKILKGLEAGQDFTKTLGAAKGFKDFTNALGKMNEIIGPWIDGIGIFSSVIGMFLPEDNELLDTIKQGFKEVNERLDDIKEGLEEVKKAIDWAVVKINFQSIEQDIRLLDEKLKEVVQAPDPADGKTEFIRVYENEYHEAGLLLWDSIVNDDQVFYENIVTAGMKYTNYRRDKMNAFVKGLIALLMKAANIEISYEKFKEQDRGMTAIWNSRLSESQASFLKTDGILENKWKDLFRDEVDSLSKELEGVSHEVFRDAVYNFLNDKYSWMHWFVLIYDDVSGWDNHGVTYNINLGHVRFRQHGRNYLISAAYPDHKFDEAAAKAAIAPRHCTESSRYCKNNSARFILEHTPYIGVCKVVIRYGKGLSMVGVQGRVAWGKMYLARGSWSRYYWMFYCG